MQSRSDIHNSKQEINVLLEEHTVTVVKHNVPKINHHLCRTSSSSPVETAKRAGLSVPAWTRDGEATPPLSACLSVSKSQTVPPQLAGPLGFPSASGARRRKGPGGCRSYAARSNLKIPKEQKEKKKRKTFIVFTSSKNDSPFYCILQRCTFKQISTFTLVYRNELHNLFTDNEGCVSWWGPSGHCISNGG